MPIYEYQCENCGESREFLQKVSDAPINECPNCHQATMKKMISAASFHLKGSGWYVTDFKDKKTKTDKTDKTEPTTSDTKTAEKQPDKKPETKKAEKASKKDSKE